MKIKCTCGTLIVDQTDYLKNKGYLISDTQWFDFWDAIDKAIEQSGNLAKEKEEACMQLRKQNIFKTLWECQNCGQLFINCDNGSLVMYTPRDKRYHKILDRKA